MVKALEIYFLFPLIFRWKFISKENKLQNMCMFMRLKEINIGLVDLEVQMWNKIQPTLPHSS